MENVNVKTMINVANLLGSATQIPVLICEYYDQWFDRTGDFLNVIEEDIQRSIETGPYRADLVKVVGNAGAVQDMIAQVSKKKAIDKRCLPEMRGALPPIFDTYVHGCKITNEIWDTLKEKY